MADSPIALPRPTSARARPWLTIMTALIVRDFGSRFRKHRPIVALFIFIEPIIIITMISTLRIYLYGKIAPFGSSVLLFMGAGIFPFYVFRNCSRGVKAPKSRAAEYFFVKPFDFLLSSFIIQQIHILLLMLIFFTCVWLSGVPEAIPHSPGSCALGLFLLALLALGVGLVNSTIRSYFESWGNLYALISRPMMMFSGAFKTVDLTPEPARTVFTWNPISHGIELFRLGIYPNYPVASLDVIYLAKWAVGSLVVGIVLYSNKAKD